MTIDHIDHVDQIDTKPATRVAIIEDHRMVAESLADVLGGEPDLEVVGIADSGEAGVELAARVRPDVALVDYRLPGIDGIEVALAIRRGSPRTRIVMLTSVVGDAVLARAIDAGCSGYVIKSSPLDEVIASVRAAARGESAISSTLLSRVLPRLSSSYQEPAGTLTAREREVLAQVAMGKGNADIAASLLVSVNTVRNHIQNTLNKLEAHSRLEAVAIAVRRGLIERV